jgi:hypothetical protein
MKIKSLLSSFVLMVAVMMLSGCIFPFWGDEGGHRGGGEHHEGGHHEGGERR